MVMALTDDERDVLLDQLTAAFAYRRAGLPTAGWWGDVAYGAMLPAWRTVDDLDRDYARYVLAGLEGDGYVG